MTNHPRTTLDALFAHPLRHNIRWDELAALWHSLGGAIEQLDDHRLSLRLPDGHQTWMHSANQHGHRDLTAEDVLRLRVLLEQAGITPDHPVAAAPAERGDQARRLVIRLDHHGADAYWLEGDRVEHASLRPHGHWAGEQTISHRHERDLAGQRAPLDHAFLQQLTLTLETADRALLLGHGHGGANLIHTLLDHVRRHRPDLLGRVAASEGVDDRALSEAELLAHAREHFGNLPHRRAVMIPGQPIHEPAARSSR